MDNNPTIPVIIDSKKKYSNFRMTRCTYFTIESSAPAANWFLGINSQRIPFLLLNISGIILSPIGEINFSTPLSIFDLFNTIENHESLYIDINEIWFPNFLFVEKSKRGDLYRVGNDLFIVGFNYSMNKIPLEEYMQLCEKYIKDFQYSEQETKSFMEYEHMVIDKAKKLYHENIENKLKWEERGKE